MKPVPTASVIIPTFNRAGVLLEAVNSALNQTFRDFEVIVVDDGSTDDTAKRLEPLREHVRYYYQENRGASAAQNRGLALARGKWIAVLASDDRWLPEKLERQLRAVTEMGPAFGACFTDCIYTGGPAQQTVFEKAGVKCLADVTALEDPQHLVAARYPALFVQSMLALRSLMVEVGGFDERLALGEDSDLIFRLAYRTRFCAVGEVLVQIDRSPAQPRLTDLFHRFNDNAFAADELRYRKWLALPDLADGPLRRKLHRDLRSHYYSWAISKLYRFQFMRAAGKLCRVHSLGHSSGRIFRTLLNRATRKFLTMLRLRRESAPP